MLVLILISILGLDSQSSIQTYPMLFCATSSPPVIRKMFSVLLTSDHHFHHASIWIAFFAIHIKPVNIVSVILNCCIWTMLFNFFVKLQTTVHWTVSTFAMHSLLNAISMYSGFTLKSGGLFKISSKRSGLKILALRCSVYHLHSRHPCSQHSNNTVAFTLFTIGCWIRSSILVGVLCNTLGSHFSSCTNVMKLGDNNYVFALCVSKLLYDAI